jgi:DNA-binding NtrC family response regulator
VIAGDATLRTFIAEALEDAGYAVVAAADPAAGMAAARAAAPAVILLHLHRARPTAGVATRYRRQLRAHAPLLLLSADGAVETATAAEALSAYGFLRLPFELDDLLTLVARAPAAAPPAAEVVPAAPPRPLAKHWREAAAAGARRRLLERLARDAAEIRAAAARVRTALQDLAAREAGGRLSRDEADRVAALRRENEALRLRLRECAVEFERLRERPHGGR